MRYFSTSVMALAVAAILSYSNFAAAEEDDVEVRDLSVQQTEAYKASPAKTSSIQLTVGVDRKNKTYASGEAVKLRVKVNEDAYVAVFNVGASGKVTQLFPNKLQKNQLIKAKHDTQIPPSNSSVAIKVSGETGAELIKVYASDKPLKIRQEEDDKGQMFLSVQGGVETLVRDLSVTDSGKPAEKLSIVNLSIKTVPEK
jgi:Domain of unknown function (DUF4384)